MILLRTCSLLAALAVLVPTTAAQTCTLTQTKADGAPFFEGWVDPIRGNDTPFHSVTNPNGFRISDPVGPPIVTVAQAQAKPFLTIQTAIDSINAILPSGGEGIVHLTAGIYSAPCQSFPIRMKSRVNVQGVGARECVLRGGGPTTVHWPILRNCLCFGEGPEMCKGLLSTTADVIVDYSQSRVGPDDYAEMIDGVTFQGGDVQVYCRAEEAAHGRISNCVFELYRYGGSQTLAGILLVHIWSDTQQKFANYNFFVLNNTFIQGWQPSETVKYTALPSSVAICDVGDPICERQGPLQSVGFTNCANNVFRSLETDPADLRTVMLGVSDAECRVNGNDCNMFNGPVAQHAGDSYSLPSSVTYADPAFVGEMLTNHFGLSEDQGRDWRVLPDSIVKGAGATPSGGMLVFDTLDPNFNNIVYTEPSVANADCNWTPIDSFDFDGEGYGNRRVIGDVDIGFDEFEFLIDGGFGNDSLAIPAGTGACTISGPFPCTGNPSNPCYCVPTGGANVHRLIMERVGPPHTLPSVTVRSKTANCPAGTYSIHPGSLLPPTISGSNVFWFASPFTTTSGLFPSVNSYTPPDSTSPTPHEFLVLNRAVANGGTFRLFQAKIGNTWSNLQASFD